MGGVGVVVAFGVAVAVVVAFGVGVGVGVGVVVVVGVMPDQNFISTRLLVRIATIRESDSAGASTWSDRTDLDSGVIARHFSRLRDEDKGRMKSK